MDLRTYRDEETKSPTVATVPTRTMLGSEQYNWLINKIESSVKSDGVVFLPFVETSSVMASGTGTCLVL